MLQVFESSSEVHIPAQLGAGRFVGRHPRWCLGVACVSTQKDAVKFLFDSYSEELRIDLYENGWNSVGEISPDGLYAKITTSFPDGEDVTEMYVGTIYSRE